jgi:hypothetical protein
MRLIETTPYLYPPVVHQMYLLHEISFIGGACNNYLEKYRMTSTMTRSERRRAYGLKRIVVSQRNYLALKRLGYAGDSFMMLSLIYC